MSHLDTCLGCRACEPACPSGVEYGHILEMARERLESERTPAQQRARRLLLSTLTSRTRLRVSLMASRLFGFRKLPALLARNISNERQQAALPRPQSVTSNVTTRRRGKNDVFFLGGCAMSVLFRRANAATIFLLNEHDCNVLDDSGSCCGALHAHNGHPEIARRMARELMRRFSGDAPVITNSAGCGSVMKQYPSLFDDPVEREAASRFSRRVRDISEHLDVIGFRPPISGVAATVAYHDACHLSNGQDIRTQPRGLLAALPGLKLVEIEGAGHCCGSAGIYNLTQPNLAKQLLDRKWTEIEATGARIVATGNPGCLSWLNQAAEERGSAVRVMHTAEVLAAGFGDISWGEKGAGVPVGTGRR
jgi:glycolate oxidase iron-sulfur subunit